MDGEAPGYRKGPVNWISRSWYMFSSCRCSRKGRNDIFSGLRSWHHGSNCTRGLPESPMVKNPYLHCRVPGLWSLVGELKFHMPCGQNKTTKLHKKQKGRWRDFLLTASNTWTPAPSSHSGLHRTHRSDISSSCIYLLFPDHSLSDLQLGLPESFRLWNFFQNSHYWLVVETCEHANHSFFLLFLSLHSTVIWHHNRFQTHTVRIWAQVLLSQPLKDKRPLGDAATLDLRSHRLEFKP